MTPHTTMQQETADLHAEQRELMGLARTLSDAQWAQRSHFYGWTPWDEIAHLCFFDQTGLLAATDEEGFARDTQALLAELATGREISAIARARYGHLDGPQLLAHWGPIAERLTAALAERDPRARLPWYGPAMSARSFATARLMETWAHGQDVWDTVGRRRPVGPRLRHIAHIGVTTFGWSFVNRKLPVPTVQPYVELAPPQGGPAWTWGDPASGEFVRGPAEDFCLLVTQRRNLADTALVHTAGSASDWLAIAQCFAGEPASAPPPGLRTTPD